MKVIFGEKTSGLNQKALLQNASMEVFEKEFIDMIQKHQISICKRYISEEVKREHCKNKTVTKRFCLCIDNKQYP